MSKSVYWQALPDDWEVLRLARSGERFVDELYLIDRCLEEDSYPLSSDPERITFCEEVRILQKMRPGIERRNFSESAGRLGQLNGWSTPLGYALDKYAFLTGRGYDGTTPTPGAKALWGVQELPSDPEYPTRYNPPLDVLEIALFLEPVPCSALEA